MAKTRTWVKAWEISFMELKNGVGERYKVTRKLPDLSIAETNVFKSKEKAQKQLEEWLK